MNDRDIITRLGLNMLVEMVAAARQGKPFYQQFGISQSTFNDLTAMNISELHTIAKTPFFQICINDRTLNLCVQRVLHNRERDTLLNEAIRYGASRMMMHHYTNMSHSEFYSRRAELGLGEIRSRPSQLTTDDYDNLATLHSQYGQLNPIKEKLDHMRCLLFLAERTNIDINRIYTYYYTDNNRLFVVDEKKG